MMIKNLRADSHLIKNSDKSKSKLVDARENPSEFFRANFLIMEKVRLEEMLIFLELGRWFRRVN